MSHEYYQYTKEELLKNPKLSVIVMKDNAEVFKSMAVEMAETIKQNNAENKTTVFICPVVLSASIRILLIWLTRKISALKMSGLLIWTSILQIDKQWVPVDHPLSFRGFMERTVYTKVKPELVMPKAQRVFPDPNNIDYIPELIEKLGGVDICFGGIGINGHVAFNEADAAKTNEEFLAQKTRVLEISKETRTANAIGDFNGALEDMPKYCVTIGIYEISHARKIRLGCFRNWHRAVVRRTAYGEATSDFPVSLLTSHKDINLKITEYVAALED